MEKKHYVSCGKKIINAPAGISQQPRSSSPVKPGTGHREDGGLSGVARREPQNPGSNPGRGTTLILGKRDSVNPGS